MDDVMSDELRDGGPYGMIPRHMAYAGALAADMGAWTSDVDMLEDIGPEFERMGHEVRRLVDSETRDLRHRADEYAADNAELESWNERLREQRDGWRARYMSSIETYRDVTQAFAELEAASGRLKATIERVRGLEKHGPTLTWDEISEALEGGVA